MSDQLSSYLILSVVLLSLGIYGVLSRRNIIAILISIELILNAANINFLAFSKFVFPQAALGHGIAVFVIALAAAEICVALSITLLVCRHRDSILISDQKELQG
jgi:NADH:ubiquinone oxidoreductase subunit K